MSPNKCSLCPRIVQGRGLGWGGTYGCGGHSVHFMFLATL